MASDVTPSFSCAAIATVVNAIAAKLAERKLGGSNGGRPTADINARGQANWATAFASVPIGTGSVVPA